MSLTLFLCYDFYVLVATAERVASSTGSDPATIFVVYYRQGWLQVRMYKVLQNLCNESLVIVIYNKAKFIVLIVSITFYVIVLSSQNLKE